MRVITYTLNKCVKCMRCLKTCQQEAITIKDERVEISATKCINCGDCINACTSSGLTAKGSTIIDIVNYSKTVCLVPSAIYCDCANETEVRKLNAALSRLGFDELVYLGEYEGVLYEKVYDVLQNNDQDIHISSFCPVVNDLIQKQFPMLLDNQNNFEYPAVLAAKDIRKKYGSEVGIFLLCECPGKLTLGKYPYGNNDSEIDHCLSIVDVFPLINMLRSDNLGELKLNESGMKLNATGLGKRIDDHILSVAGLVKVRKALELCEFGLLKDVKYLSLSACFNGCIGGQFLWGNPFNGRVNMKNLLQYANVETKEYSIEEIQRQQTYTHTDQINMIQKLKRFNKVNEIFDKLPGFDCGACGYPSCRGLAEAIVDENQSINDCNIIRKREQYAG